MAWLQLETTSGQVGPRLLEDRLTKLGAVATWLSDAGDDPVLEPEPGTMPLWPTSLVTALFPAETHRENLCEGLADLVRADQIRFSDVADRDWEAEFQATLHPMQFGKRLWVVPNAGAVAADDAVTVRLQPGMAFGTGEHPTTAMCLRWLDQQPLNGRCVLDYGCGSGLLAIAALALGAESACGVDIDLQALDATRDNAQNNGCASRLRVAKPDELGQADDFDFLVANILSGPLIELSATLNALTRPGARIAITGILAEQAMDVCAAWADWVDLEQGDKDGDWIMLTGRKRASAS